MRSIAASLLVAGALAAVVPAQATDRAVEPTTLRIVVGKHGVAGGPKRFTVKKGTHVVLSVRSAIGEAVHLHGYGLEKPIKGRTVPVRIAFVARVTGVFEIEIHLTETRALQVGLLTVK
jgi:hypothetical protein